MTIRKKVSFSFTNKNILIPIKGESDLKEGEEFMCDLTLPFKFRAIGINKKVILARYEGEDSFPSDYFKVGKFIYPVYVSV